jgi:hypothetical protein
MQLVEDESKGGVQRAVGAVPLLRVLSPALGRRAAGGWAPGLRGRPAASVSMSATPPEQQHATDDDEYWILPPPGEDGAPVWVELSFVLNRVSAVDTVTGTAFFKVYVVFHWTDPRLVGWPAGKPLPPQLWGPRLFLVNALGDLEEVDGAGFTLVDASTGRLKRGRNYSGSVDNPMELRTFPFDMDNIKLDFLTASDFESLNGERTGSSDGKTYRLRRISDPGDIGLRTCSSTWLTMEGWKGRIAEWTLHGISSNINERPPDASGFEITDVSIGFHVSRRAGYYFWKALLPLYLLTALSMGTFQFETDNLPDRTSTVSTYFLAAFAMLYVVGEALPKTDFLTKIDQVIVISTVSLASTGIVSMALAKLHKERGEEVADRWNMIAAIGLSGFYVLANLVIFVPAWWNQRSAVMQLDSYKHTSSIAKMEGIKDSDKNAMFGAGEKMPQTVEQGHDYVTLAELLGQGGITYPTPADQSPVYSLVRSTSES